MKNRKQKKVFIIHFQPLEAFPPVMNIIDYLARNPDLNLIVVTNQNSKFNLLSSYNNLNGNVKIYRPAKIGGSVAVRYLNYFLFYIGSFILLIKHHPKIIFYFETLSSWPALLYKGIMGKEIRIMAHYHEYTEPQLYRHGMFLSKWIHRLESKMYENFSWISHTNLVRLQMFKDDNHLNKLQSSVFHAIPNYPSKMWNETLKNDDSVSRVKRLIFVGSLGYDNMYLKEVIDWVGSHQDIFSLDVYSYNIDFKAEQALKNCGFKNIRYHSGCDYQKLPNILKNYDIGLDIYKPFALNHVYGVSNKVFEYLACDLDVWFSVDKPQTFQYERSDKYPKVIPVNFMDLNSFDFISAMTREGLVYKPSNYFFENVYPEILNIILNQGTNIES